MSPRQIGSRASLPAVAGAVHHGARASPALEPMVAAVLVLILGAGLMLSLAGWSAGDTTRIAAGAAPAAFALCLLVATGWISMPVVVALSIPLPALYSSESLRIAAAAPVTAVAVAGWVLGVLVSRRPVRTGHVPATTTLALCGAFLIATLFARHPLLSLRELANFALLILLLVAATDAFSRDRYVWPRTARLLVGIAAAAGVLAVLEMAGILPGEFPRFDSSLNRASLGFGQPNGLGMFFAIVIPFAVHLLRTSGTGMARLTAAAALACVIAGLIATFSRGSWLSVMAGSIVLLFAGEPRFAFRVWTGMLIVALVVDLGSGILRDTVARTIGDWTIEQRFGLMAAGILMFLAHPIAGVGPGGYAESLGEFGPMIPGLSEYLATPHNAFVQMAAEAGVIGVSVFLLFLFTILRGQLRRIRALDGERSDTTDASLARATLWSIATLIATCMVAWPFGHGTGQAMMLVMAGAFASPRAGRP